MSHTEATCGSWSRNIWANILVLAPGLGDFQLTDSPLGVSASWCGRKYHLHGWLWVKLILLLPPSSLKRKGHLVNAWFSSDQPGEKRQLGRHSFPGASGTRINCLLQKVLIWIIQNAYLEERHWKPKGLLTRELQHREGDKGGEQLCEVFTAWEFMGHGSII